MIFDFAHFPGTGRAQNRTGMVGGSGPTPAAAIQCIGKGKGQGKGGGREDTKEPTVQQERTEQEESEETKEKEQEKKETKERQETTEKRAEKEAKERSSPGGSGSQHWDAANLSRRPGSGGALRLHGAGLRLDAGASRRRSYEPALARGA